jgi:hypothetical protein
MKIWTFLALAAAGAAAPARADITATYVADGPGMVLEMKVEIAAGGDLRADMNVPGLYMIKREGRSYFVITGPSGPIVQDFEDMGAVVREELSRTQPDLCDQFDGAGSSFKLVPRGTVTIAGRTGEAYAPAGHPQHTEMVISRDPALAPLGEAMAAQFRASTIVMGECVARTPMFVQMLALLESGAPLQFGPMHLATVTTGPVDPARFVLPAAPASREEVRALMIRNSGRRVTVVEAPDKR